LSIDFQRLSNCGSRPRFWPAVANATGFVNKQATADRQGLPYRLLSKAAFYSPVEACPQGTALPGEARSHHRTRISGGSASCGKPLGQSANNRRSGQLRFEGLIFSDNRGPLSHSTKKGCEGLLRYYVRRTFIRTRRPRKSAPFPPRLGAGMVEDAVVNEVRAPFLQTRRFVDAVSRA